MTASAGNQADAAIFDTLAFPGEGIVIYMAAIVPYALLFAVGCCFCLHVLHFS
jgi:hypothetical protein